MKRSLWELWNTIKRNNIHIIEIPEGKVTKSLFKAVMAENFPNLGRHMDIQTHESQRNPKEGYTEMYYN